jgi:hypothetical protein
MLTSAPLTETRASETSLAIVEAKALALVGALPSTVTKD